MNCFTEVVSTGDSATAGIAGALHELILGILGPATGQTWDFGQLECEYKQPTCSSSGGSARVSSQFSVNVVFCYGAVNYFED